MNEPRSTPVVNRSELIDEAVVSPHHVRTTCEQLLLDDRLSAVDKLTALLGKGWTHYATGELHAVQSAMASARSLVADLPADDSAIIDIERLEIAVLSAEGEHKQAETQLVRAIESYQGLNRARLFSSLGQIQFSHRELEMALQSVQRGLEDADRFLDLRSRAALLVNRAIVEVELGRLRHARHDLETAISLGSEVDASAVIAAATNNLGVVEARGGNLARALAYFGRSSELVRASSGVIAFAHALLDQATVLLEAGLFAEARAAAAEALDVFVHLRADHSSAVAAMQVAETSAAAGRWSTAFREAQVARSFAQKAEVTAGGQRILAAARQLERTLKLVGIVEAGDFQNAMLQDLELEEEGYEHAGVLLDCAIVMCQIGRPAPARLLAQRCLEIGARSAADELTNHVARVILAHLDNDDLGVQQAVEEGLEHARTSGVALAVTELRAMLVRRIDQLASFGVRRDHEHNRIAAIIDKLERVRGISLMPEPLISQSDLATLAKLRAINKSLAELPEPTAELLAERSSLEAHLRHRRRVLDGATAHDENPPRRTQLPAQTLYLFALDDFLWMISRRPDGDLASTQIAPVSELRRSLRGLRLLLGRRAAGADLSIDRSVDNVRRMLHPVLDELDRYGYAAIVVEPTLDPIPWSLLTDTTIRQTPSLALADDRGGGLSAGESAALFAGPGIALANDEVHALGKLLPGARLFTGADATSSNAMEAFSSASLVHFATHGSFRADRPLHSSVELADGPLTFFELLNERAPDRIVFSSCEVGRSASASPMGLATLLLSRGTRELVASNGPNNDATTYHLMQEMYGHLAPGTSLAQALALGQRGLRDRHPSVGLFAAFGARGAAS